MKPRHSGRYCESCQKTVTDFTGMPDTQLAAFFKKNTGDSCGRFDADQLNKNILIPKKPLPWVKYFFTAGLPAFLLSLKAGAQRISETAATGIYDIKAFKADDPATRASSLPKRLITGSVIDQKGEPVAGASITVSYTRFGTAADEKGNFKLHVPAGSDTIVINSVSYASQEISIKGKDSVRVVLAESHEMYLGAVFVYRPKKKKFKALPQAGKPDHAVSRVEPNEISIFPNPVLPGGKLNLTWKNKVSGDQLLDIFSADGDPVQSDRIRSLAKTNESFIYLHNLPAGFYILRVTDLQTKQMISKEFVIQ